MKDFPKIKRMGEQGILLEFEPNIAPLTLEKVLDLKRYLKDNLFKSKVEITNTYNSLLISCDTGIEDAYGEILSLVEGFELANIRFKSENRLFSIPVCYDDIFSLDLDEISVAKNLSRREIIELHTSPDYLVYFTGFLPGFLYLGGLHKSLHFSRKKHPRGKVEKGAVGIGEKQTGIYPQPSPGGWNIIGNSPVPLFDSRTNPPCEIRAGDKIRFYEVDIKKHTEISRQIENGDFILKSEK